MKIVQSFAQFEEGSPYLLHQNKPDYIYLSFYSFLLSQLTVTKHHGSIIMFCNQQAYDSFFKYIPYGEIVIKENKNEFLMWATYKLDVLRTINDDFLHVDSDVFISGDSFKSFIDGECDVLIQDVVPRGENKISQFGYNNKDFLADTLILTKPYDGRCFSCGTLGLNKKIQEYYFAGIDVLYKAMLNFGLENFDKPTLLLEEQLLYYITIENNFKYKSVISDELVQKYGIENGGDMIGYRHFWFRMKFKKQYINYIRHRIFFEFPEYYEIILKYEKDVLSKFKFFQGMNFPKIY